MTPREGSILAPYDCSRPNVGTLDSDAAAHMPMICMASVGRERDVPTPLRTSLTARGSTRRDVNARHECRRMAAVSPDGGRLVMVALRGRVTGHGFEIPISWSLARGPRKLRCPDIGRRRADASPAGCAPVRGTGSVRRLEEGGVGGRHRDQGGSAVDSRVSAVEQPRELLSRFVGRRAVAEGPGGRGIAGGTSLEVAAGLAGLPVFVAQLGGGWSEGGQLGWAAAEFPGRGAQRGGRHRGRRP